MIHLNYFLDYLDRSRDDNQSLLDMEDHIKQSHPKAFEIGSKIYDVITQHTGLDLYKSERVYLVLHIQRFYCPKNLIKIPKENSIMNRGSNNVRF